MRKIAFILFGLGLLLGFVYPRIIGTKTGETLAEAQVYDGKSDQWRPLHLDLTPAENPVRIRVLVDTFPEHDRSVLFFDLVAKITDPAGDSVELPFTIRRDDGAGNNPTSDVSRSFALLPELTIDNPGTHVISLRQKRDLPLNMKAVTVEVIGSGMAVNNSLAGLGVPLMIAGAILFFLDIRRRNRRQIPPEPIQLPGMGNKVDRRDRSRRKDREDNDGENVKDDGPDKRREDENQEDNAMDDDDSKKTNPRVGDIWTREARPEPVKQKSGGEKSSSGSIWDRSPQETDDSEGSSEPDSENQTGDVPKIKKKSSYKWGRNPKD